MPSAFSPSRWRSPSKPPSRSERNVVLIVRYPCSLTNCGLIHQPPFASHALLSTLANLSAHKAPPLTIAEVQLVRDRVCALVDELKTAGVTPERVIVAIKEVARDAHIDGHVRLLDASNGREPYRPSAGLLDSMVKWCIERYYAKS
jgi:hypothetical protein